MAHSRHRSSAAPLACLYAGLIAYASLAPFTGWTIPHSVPRFGFGHMPWSPYWTAFDVLSNLLGYMPFGALVFGAMVRSGRHSGWAAATATVAGALLSLCMESLQHYLPQRVPSILDWAVNSAGALVGVLVGWVLSAMGAVDRWQVVRDRWFIPRSAGAIALLLSWPAGLLFPTPVPLGVGQVLLRLQELAGVALADTPWSTLADGWLDAQASLVPLSRGGELLTILLGLLAPCLVAFSVVQPGWRRAFLVLTAAVLGFAATTLSTALNFGPQHALAWLTPPALPALGLGILLAFMLSDVPRRGAAGIGLVAITALVALVAQAPSDPYYAESLFAWEQGRFIRFHGIAQWIGWLWPYAALWYLFGRVVARDEPIASVPDASSSL